MLELIHGAGPLYPAAPRRDDDEAALRLLAAVCEVARRDADAGCAEAAAFLDELQAHRPAGWKFTGVPCSPVPSTTSGQIRELAERRGWPAPLPPGSVADIAEVLKVGRNHVSSVLSRLRRAASERKAA